MNISVKFERCFFVSSLVLKSPPEAKPQTYGLFRRDKGVLHIKISLRYLNICFRQNQALICYCLYLNSLSAASISVSRFRCRSPSLNCTGMSTATPGSICSPCRSTVWVTDSRYCQPLGNSPEDGAPPPPPV